MDIAVILLGILNLILLLILWFSLGTSKTAQSENIRTLTQELSHFIVDYQDKQKSYQSQEFQGLRQSVDHKLEQGLEKSRQGLTQVIERLVKIDQAQRTIEGLSSNIVDLQNILTDKKSRGIFGEVQLAHLLETVFGEAKGRAYDLQKGLSNGKIADAVIYLPEPFGLMAVDSKFPMENYKRMVDFKLEDSQRELARKEFGRNVKKHIDDIAGKYILKGETAEQAMMFLPAEAIFSELYAYHHDLVEYAMKSHIWMTSPTTFMATLTTIQGVMVNIERSKKMDKIHYEINKLGEEFSRYEERWNDFSKHVGTIFKDREKLEITHRKLNDRFQKIMQADF